MRDDRGAEGLLPEGLGHDRPAVLTGPRRDPPGLVRLGQVTEDDEGALRQSQRRRGVGARGGVGLRRTGTGLRFRVRRPSLGPRRVTGVGHERLAQRDVEVGRAGRTGARLCGRRGAPGDSNGPHRGGSPRRGVADVGGDLGLEADDVAEHPGLRRRLVRTDAAQLGRPVGADDEERHEPVVGLEDRGVEVRHGRAGRRDDGGRHPAQLRQTEREEPGRAFVDPHVETEPARPVRALQGVCEGCRPGARGEDDVPHPRGEQAVDDGPREARRRVHERDSVTLPTR